MRTTILPLTYQQVELLRFRDEVLKELNATIEVAERYGSIHESLKNGASHLHSIRELIEELQDHAIYQIEGLARAARAAMNEYNKLILELDGIFRAQKRYYQERLQTLIHMIEEDPWENHDEGLHKCLEYAKIPQKLLNGVDSADGWVHTKDVIKEEMNTLLKMYHAAKGNGDIVSRFK